MRSILQTIGWGVFCACSWTWCIGMYLPKLMIEHFGPAGFLAFAVPNVIGCAAFGYVVATRERSAAMIERHGTVMVAFSGVAIAFHMLFVAVLFGSYLLDAGSPPWLPLVAALLVFVLGTVLAQLEDRAWPGLAVAVYVVSLLVFAAIAMEGEPQLPDPIDGAGSLVWLTPILAIGFVLCPYLDLTFHRALRNAPSRHAFGVFSMTFAVMLALTVFVWFAPSPVWRGLGLGHITAQAIFTVGAHLREMKSSPVFRDTTHHRLFALLPLVVTPLPIIAGLFTDAADLGDQLYIRFLVFYSLVFPAYVLVFMGPRRPAAVTRRAIVTLLVVIALLMPVYEIGFVHGRMWLLAIPTGVAALWFVRRR